MAADPAFARAADNGPPFSSDGPPYEGPADDLWVVTANLLFLHNIARTHGTKSGIVAANQDLEPETTSLVLEVVTEGVLTDAAAQDQHLSVALATLWERILEAAIRRRRRVS